MIWNQTYETLAREDLEQVQLERLQATLNRVVRYVSFYKQSFDDHGVDVEDIKSVRDLARLPFTTKEDLRRSYPYDMFAVPLRDIVRIHSTSGTTGLPIVVGYTKNDLRHWTECTARLLTSAGVTDHDAVQIAFPLNLFTGGFGFYQGAEQIGASVIPSSTETAVRQIRIMKDYKSTVLVCAPSFAATVAAALEEQGLHAETLNLRVGLFGSEPWSEALRTQLEGALRLTALDNYGLTEVIGPGVAGECPEKQGLHINEDHFIVEVIDPTTLEPVPAGQEGELVFTTLTKEGFPVIRYRTGDLSGLLEGPCACGRTLRRMQRVARRLDDLIFVQGHKILPSQIEEILLEAEGTAPHYRIVLDRTAGQDTIEVQVEVLEEFLAIDELKSLERLRDRIAGRLEAVLGITARVALVESRSLRQGTGEKLQRIVDRRHR